MKIDVNSIAGYAEMTVEQKLAALEGFNIPDPDHTGYVKKEVFDKAASDAADWKKKFRETQSDAERAAAEQAENLATMQQELESLKQDKTIAGYSAKLAGLGYSGELADSTARALASGDMETVFANQQSFMQSYAQRLQEAAMKNTARPAAGAGTPTTPDYRKKAAEYLAAGERAKAAQCLALAQQQEAAE